MLYKQADVKLLWAIVWARLPENQHCDFCVKYPSQTEKSAYVHACVQVHGHSMYIYMHRNIYLLMRVLMYLYVYMYVCTCTTKGKIRERI